MKKYITYLIHYYIFIYPIYKKYIWKISGYYDSNITNPQPK
jgi:hypothetical protein